MIADLEESEMLDASDIYPLRIKAQEVLISQKMMNSFSRSQMEQQNCQEEIMNSEPTDDAEAHGDFFFFDPR